MVFHDDQTPLNAENMNKGNWRDDKSISYESLVDNSLPSQKFAKTQIVTKQNGELWAIPPSDTEQEPFKLDTRGPAFFRLEVRNGDLWLITPGETNPLHIDANGHLILSI